MLYKAHCIYVMSGVCSFEHYPNINEFYLALSFSFFLSSICTHSFMTNMRFIMVSSHTTLHFSPASFCLQVIIFALANVKISLIPTLLFFRFVHFFCLEKQSCYSPFPVPNGGYWCSFCQSQEVTLEHLFFTSKYMLIKSGIRSTCG